MERGRLGDRLRRIPVLAVDAALVAAVAVANALAIGAEQEVGAKDPDALAYALGVAIAAPLLVRRRWPLGVLLASVVVLMTYHALDYPAIGLAVPLAVALFTATAAGHLRATAILALGLQLFAIGFRALEEGESLVSVIGTGTLAEVALVAAVLLLAEMLRTRQAWMAEVRERLRRTEAERQREAERRIGQERLRIAHELHDVLAHTVAVIGVQADVAAEALADSPEDAQASLRTIREKSREALAELRATVGVLREPREGALRAPAPGLSRLEELVGMAAGAGVQVEVSVFGSTRPLPAIVDLTAYRIVQESLTNVLRHAGASLATVSIRYEPDAVVVQVDDDGRGAANGAAEGYGVAGMRGAGVGDRRAIGGRTGAAAGRRLSRACLAPERAGAGVSIRVLLADDQTLVRSGFWALLERSEDIEVIGEAADGAEAVELARSERPDVVLMDVRMPGVDGIEAARRIAADPELAAVRVIMLTTFELDEYVFEALHAGASGFLLKDVEPGELRAAVRVVSEGEALLSPSVTRKLISEYVVQPGRHRPPPEKLAGLTEREREVMALVAAGLSNAAIAERLVISPATAKTHVSRTMMKLHAHDRAQLVVLAYETGLVRPPQ